MKRTSTLLLCFVAAVLATSVQAQTTNTNTVVRFRIGYGTTLYGNVDFELFNDKPATVTNFLKYLQRGAYANSILHDCRPGFALVGGLGAVINPYSAANFDALYRIPEDASVTNEFHVGTVRSNLFGTLAMKKETTSPNSATTQWLINLGNNTDGVGVTNLDTYLDGFTVFGQVIAGANVLQAFNQFTYSGGIADQLDATYLHFCRGYYMFPGGEYQGFDALPVGFSGAAYLNCIQYNDLFTVQLSMLSGPDVTAPKAAITFPKNKASVTNEVLTVTGTGSDNIGVATVRVYLNTNAAVTAAFTNGNWTAVISNVPPGTNTLLVEAADAAGNRSQSQISFFRSVRVPLSLTIVGDGTVSGATDGQMLELTRAYTIAAKPTPGNIFAAWSGSVTSATPSIRFVMEPDTAFTATFATNYFPAVRGVYNGLFQDPNQVAQLSAGAVNLTVANSGAYSAKLLMNGKTYRFSGSFSPDGAETNLVDRPGTNGLLLRLAIDLTNGTEQITGSITNNQTTSINPGFGWQAELRADRAVFDGRTRVSPDAGKYTLLVPRDTNSPAGPDGDGFGTATISTKGALSFNGTLADGTKATQKTTVAKDGSWPLYVPLYQDKGFLFGWLNFTNETSTDFSGQATWVKQKQINARYYLHGFTNETTILGSRYVAPTTNRVVAITNGLVAFAGGDLTASFTNNVRLEANNKVTNLSSNKLTLAVVKGTGLLNGTVTPPGSTRSQPYKGAVLQKQNRGGGFILGITKSGAVEFQAEEE